MNQEMQVYSRECVQRQLVCKSTNLHCEDSQKKKKKKKRVAKRGKMCMKESSFVGTSMYVKLRRNVCKIQFMSKKNSFRHWL